VDRHEHIGKGHIGVEAFRLLMNDKRFWGVPMCLETPKGLDLAEDRENLGLLRSLFIRSPVVQRDTALLASAAQRRQSSGPL
jgi:deoxyribonuclease IV